MSRIHRLQEIENLCGLHGTVTVYGCKTIALLQSDSFNFVVLKDTSMEATTYSFRSCIRGYHVYQRWQEKKNLSSLRIWRYSINE